MKFESVLRDEQLAAYLIVPHAVEEKESHLALLAGQAKSIEDSLDQQFVLPNIDRGRPFPVRRFDRYLPCDRRDFAMGVGEKKKE